MQYFCGFKNGLPENKQPVKSTADKSNKQVSLETAK